MCVRHLGADGCDGRGRRPPVAPHPDRPAARARRHGPSRRRSHRRSLRATVDDDGLPSKIHADTLRRRAPRICHVSDGRLHDAHTARRAPVRGPEEPAEVAGVAQAPATCDRQHRLAGERRVLEVAAAALEPARADPLRNRDALALEEPVQVSREDGLMLAFRAELGRDTPPAVAQKAGTQEEGSECALASRH